MIAMLLEAYFQEAQIRFHAMGSATFRKALKRRGLEPDECYCLGTKKEFPDLAVEIVLSSGLIDKLSRVGYTGSLAVARGAILYLLSTFRWL